MTKLIKHRGMHNEDYIENTYEGIKEAFLNPLYSGVEFDVRETIDHELIIFHNPLYNGKLIKDTLYKELPKYVPRLKDILEIKTDKIFLVEIKNMQSFSKFIKLLNHYQNKNIYVMSFYKDLIDKVRVPNRTYKIGLLNYVFNTTNESDDFIVLIDSMINDNTLKMIRKMEVFSYGVSKNKKDYKRKVTYIVP